MRKESFGRWTPVVLGLLSLSWSQLASAKPFAPPPSDALWDGEVRLDAPGELDRTTPQGVSGNPSQTASITPVLTGTYYLHPLIDEQEGELALLNFYQHPGQISLAITLANEFSDVSTGWSATRKAVSVVASGEGYPWHETGIEGSAGANFSGLSGTQRAAYDVSYSAGFVHYFRPTFRLDVLYVGGVSETTTAVQSAQAPALQDENVATNLGRVRGEAVVLHDRLSVAMQLDLGQFTQDRTATSLTGQTLPGDYTSGILFGVQAEVIGYWGRQVSAGLLGGVNGQSATTTSDQSQLGTAERNQLTPYVGPELQYFILDNLYLKAAYQLLFPRVRADGAPGSDGINQVITLSFAGRL
jgi:hypothetical protein